MAYRIAGMVARPSGTSVVSNAYIRTAPTIWCTTTATESLAYKSRLFVPSRRKRGRKNGRRLVETHSSSWGYDKGLWWRQRGRRNGQAGQALGRGLDQVLDRTLRCDCLTSFSTVVTNVRRPYPHSDSIPYLRRTPNLTSEQGGRVRATTWMSMIKTAGGGGGVARPNVGRKAARSSQNRENRRSQSRQFLHQHPIPIPILNQIHPQMSRNVTT